MHLAVYPATHDIVVAEMPLENIHNVEVLPTLLNLERRKLRRVYADSKASYQLIAKGATACISPRKNAGLWNMGHPRNEAALMMRKEGPAPEKKSGYRSRSLAETAMCQFTQLMTGGISLPDYNGQVGKVIAYVSAI